MAGSYKHIIKPDGSYRGSDLLDNMGDAAESLEECFAMIRHLTGGNPQKAFEAWRDGYYRRVSPTLADQITFDQWWGERAPEPSCVVLMKYDEAFTAWCRVDEFPSVNDAMTRTGYLDVWRIEDENGRVLVRSD